MITQTKAGWLVEAPGFHRLYNSRAHAERVHRALEPEGAIKALEPCIQDALSELLSALGFGQMAHDVLTETDAYNLRRYARIVLVESEARHKGIREVLESRFAELGLVPPAGYWTRRPPSA